jgi:hypothetical protein
MTSTVDDIVGNDRQGKEETEKERDCTSHDCDIIPDFLFMGTSNNSIVFPLGILSIVFVANFVKLSNFCFFSL